MKLYRRSVLVKYEYPNAKDVWITDFLDHKERTFTLKEDPNDKEQLMEKINKRLQKKLKGKPYRIEKIRPDGWILHNVDYNEDIKVLHNKLDELQEEIRKLKEQIN